MKNVRVGNVIALHNSLVIVSKVHSDPVEWISFDSSNSSGSTDMITKHITEYDVDDVPHTIELAGIDKAIYVADNVYEYILQSMIKNFDFFRIKA